MPPGAARAAREAVVLPQEQAVGEQHRELSRELYTCTNAAASTPKTGLLLKTMKESELDQFWLSIIADALRWDGYQVEVRWGKVFSTLPGLDE